ncbi:MAG: hypothetical protein ACFE9L_05415 [Candidatus Hodarchaeota archaeon]
MNLLNKYNYEEVIEINSSSLLLVKKSKDKLLGSVIEITQLLKEHNQVVARGLLILPVNRLCLSTIISLQEYCKRKVEAQTPHERISEFLENAMDQARHPPDPTPLSIQRMSGNYQIAPVNPERLQESVLNTSFYLEDLVHALQWNKSFSTKIKLALNQVKVLLYYEMMGKPQMITMDVEKELLKLNISYDFKKTGMLLKELAAEKLIGMEERISKNQRTYRFWKFPALNPAQSGKESKGGS